MKDSFKVYNLNTTYIYVLKFQFDVFHDEGKRTEQGNLLPQERPSGCADERRASGPQRQGGGQLQGI